MADLSLLDNQNVTTVYTVPGTDIKLTLHGIDSDEYLQAAKNFAENTPDGNLKELNASLVKSCIIDWENVSFDGEELDCTDENKDKLAAIPWIVRKVVVFIDNEQNFLPKQKSD